MEIGEMREQLCKVCHMMGENGWGASNDGNVSVKLGEGRFLATPTGVSKKLMEPEMLVVIDEKGNLVEASGAYRPSSEIKMHLRCYAERPDIGAAVHSHPPAATAYAAAGVPLADNALIEAFVNLGEVPVAPYAAPSTEEVPDSVAPLLKNHDAVLIANHGALTVGVDLMHAYFAMETLEHWAQISLNAKLLGGAKPIPPERLDQLYYLRTHYYHCAGRHPYDDSRPDSQD